MREPTSVGESWTRIIAWLRANAPANAVETFPQTDQDAIGSTAAGMGLVFPNQLTAFYLRLDGAETGSVFPSPNDDDMAYSPMPLPEVRATWFGQKELVEMGQFADCTPRSADGIPNVWWDTAWIPFATNGGGDFLCVDTAPTAAGCVGQVLSHSHETGEHRILSRSLADYLQDLASRLEQREFVYHDKYGIRSATTESERVECHDDDTFTGMSEWHFANAVSAAEEAFKNKDYALCVAHLERFESQLDKVSASRLAFAKKKAVPPQ